MTPRDGQLADGIVCYVAERPAQTVDSLHECVEGPFLHVADDGTWPTMDIVVAANEDHIFSFEYPLSVIRGECRLCRRGCRRRGSQQCSGSCCFCGTECSSSCRSTSVSLPLFSCVDMQDGPAPSLLHGGRRAASPETTAVQICRAGRRRQLHRWAMRTSFSRKSLRYSTSDWIPWKKVESDGARRSARAAETRSFWQDRHREQGSRQAATGRGCPRLPKAKGCCGTNKFLLLQGFASNRWGRAWSTWAALQLRTRRHNCWSM